MSVSGSALVERLVAVEAAEGVKIEWLGSLVWSTITESAVTADQLRAAAAAAGIDERYIPAAANPKDAMRRAARAAEVKHEQLDPKGERFVNLLVREVTQTPAGLVYHLVREVVDGGNRRLEYAPVAEIEQKDTSATWHEIDGSTPEPMVVDAIQRAMDAFHHHQHYYDGAAIRRMVTRVLADCHPVAVRPSGGVLFVPLKYADTVSALRTLVTELAQFGTTEGHRSVFRAVPVVDAADQRDMVRQSLEEQVQAESDTILRDMQQALTGGKITTKAAETFITRVQTLQALAGDYEEVLRTKQTDVEAVLDLVMRQARRLLEVAE